LSKAESEEEGNRGSLHEEERVGTSDEDKSLRDLSDLEVDDHVEFGVVVVGDVGDTESVAEELGVDDDTEEGDGSSGEVETVSESVGENLSEIPRVGSRGRKDTIEGEGHDGSVVEKGDNKNHEGREIELESESHDSETDDYQREGKSVN